MRLFRRQKIRALFAVALGILPALSLTGGWSAHGDAEVFPTTERSRRGFEAVKSLLAAALDSETIPEDDAITGAAAGSKRYPEGMPAAEMARAEAHSRTRDDMELPRRQADRQPRSQQQIELNRETGHLPQTAESAGALHRPGLGQDRQTKNPPSRNAIPGLATAAAGQLLLHPAHAPLQAGLITHPAGWGIVLALALLGLALRRLWSGLKKRRHAEESLWRSETNLDIILHSIGEAVLATDSQRRVTWLNPIAVQLTGWTEAEALGRPVEEVFRLVHEQARQPVVLPADDVLASGQIRRLANHTVLLARDGTERSIADTLAPLRDRTGSICGLVLVFRDVTEERRAEKHVTALLRELNDVRRALDHHAIVAVTDAAGKITYVNDKFCELSGYAREELLGQDHRLLNSGHHSKTFFRNLWQTILRGEQWQGVIKNRAKDGSFFWVATTIVPLLNADGKPREFIAIRTDVTEHKRMEEELARLNAELERQVEERTRAARLMEARLNHLLRNTPAVIYSCRPFGDGGATFVSESARREFGYEPAQFLADPAFWSDRVHPEDRERVLRGLRAVLAAGGEHYASEYRFRHADGSYRWYHDEATVVRAASGELQEIVGSMVDITERKRAEEQLRAERLLLRTLVDHLPLAIYVKDKAGRKTLSNPVDQRNLGVGSEAEALGRTDFDFFPREQAERFAADDRQVLDEGIPVLGREEQLTRPDGSQIWQLTYKVPWRNPEGTIVGLIGFGLDITERKRLEEERAALEKQQRRRQRLESLGTLAGGVAHDLNNALAPILLSVEMLRVSYPNETKMLDILHASAQRAAGMVRQLLTFAKGAEGARVAVQVAHLLKEMRGILQGTFPKNIQVEVRLDRNLPTVQGDPTQLHQVLLNLCLNARDAMPHGGTLTLEAQRHEVDALYAASMPDAKPGRYVALRVKDSGIGMPPEILERIFDPFFTTKGPDKGTGLGLATVHGIVKGYGGFVRVYSQPGRGSTFEVYLPAEKSGADTEHLVKPATPFRGRGETILVVDDEAAIRAVQRSVLERLNFTPLIARDGAEGLVQVAMHHGELHALLVDLHMPEMDGVAFIRAVRRLLPQIPIAAMSGRFEEAVRGELAGLGVTMLLSKPFTETELAKALEQMLAPPGGE